MKVVIGAATKVRNRRAHWRVVYHWSERPRQRVERDVVVTAADVSTAREAARDRVTADMQTLGYRDTLSVILS